MTTRAEGRAKVLAAFGANGAMTAELFAYDPDGFGEGAIPSDVRFPLADEPFVDTWREYSRIASSSGFEALGDRLVQLRFPIREGISQTEAYRAVTRRGTRPADLSLGAGIQLRQPERCTVSIHPTWAGAIPVVQTGSREDFEALVRAFTARNEPVAVPASQGACIVAGYNNWDRVRRLQDRWTLEHVDRPLALGDLAERKDEYQDRFLLLSDGWYSGVPPERLALTAPEWRRLSLIIRREHECAHYWTRRVRSSMRNRIFDEVIADYAGMFAACGRFRADWFLAFLGVDGEGVAPEGRLRNYRGTPPLSDASFDVLRHLVLAAAGNLERFDGRHADVLQGAEGLLVILLTLSGTSLEQLASRDAQEVLESELSRSRTLVASGVTGDSQISLEMSGR
jgi:hypothetical protein